MTIADRILDLLADSPDGLKRRELVSALEDLTPGTVDATLHDMGKAGRIKRDPITSQWQVSDEPMRPVERLRRDLQTALKPDAAAGSVMMTPAPPLVTGSIREPAPKSVPQELPVATVTIGGMVITITGVSPEIAHRALAAALQAMQ
jgi:hypothetical protein